MAMMLADALRIALQVELGYDHVAQLGEDVSQMPSSRVSERSFTEVPTTGKWLIIAKGEPNIQRFNKLLPCHKCKLIPKELPTRKAQILRRIPPRSHYPGPQGHDLLLALEWGPEKGSNTVYLNPRHAFVLHCANFQKN